VASAVILDAPKVRSGTHVAGLCDGRPVDGVTKLEVAAREESVIRCYNPALDECTWSDRPRRDRHKHAADALRQKAQGFRPPSRSFRRRHTNRSAMAV
jgi:hypothetical protein